MPRAKLAVRIPEHLWIHDVSTAHPEVAFRIVSVLPGTVAAVGVLEVVASNPIPVLADMDDHADVHTLELLSKRGETALVQVETSTPSLLAPVRRAGVPVETPFEVEDGVVTWEVTTSSKRLSALGSSLEEEGVEYELESVHDEARGHANRLVTDRQLEVFLTALEEGFYDVPREATLTDVAACLGISKSTCSDVLHRAEGRIARWFAEEHTDRGTRCYSNH